jgi:hypothetical protein
MQVVLGGYFPSGKICGKNSIRSCMNFSMDTDPFEHDAKVLEDLPELGLEVVLSYDFAIASDGNSAGDEVQMAGSGLGCVAVSPLRGRRTGRIDIGDTRVGRVLLLLVEPIKHSPGSSFANAQGPRQ